MNKKSGLVRMVLCKITVLQNGRSSPFKIFLTKIFYRKTAGVVYGRFVQFFKVVFVHMRRYEKSPAKAGLFKNIFWFLYTENHRRNAEIDKEG